MSMQGVPPRHPVIDAPPRVGDVLLVPEHGPDPSTLPARAGGSGWRVLAAAPGWRLLATEPGPGWVGYGAAPLGTGILLGTLVGNAIPADAAALDRQAGGLRGSWLAMVPDTDGSGAWAVTTDRFGSVHAYHRDGVVGTFSPSVVAASDAGRRAPDWEGITLWAAFGFVPGDRTLHQDLRILRPGRRYRFAGGPPVVTRTWEWHHEPVERPVADHVAGLADHLEAVLANELALGPLSLPISGGLDSRSTVAGLTRAGQDPPAGLQSYSYGWSDRSVETRIARRIARARGLPYQEWVIGPYLLDQLDRATDLLEGFQDVCPPRQLGVAEQMGALAPRVVAAHWGDVWLDSAGWTGARRPDAGMLADALLAKLRKPGRDWLLTHLCAPHLSGDPEALQRDVVLAGLAELPPLDDPDMTLKAFKTEHWSFRWTLASLRAHRAGAEPVLPFYDPLLVDHLLTVPTAAVAGRALQLEYLRRRAPDLAAITWQAHDTDLFAVARPPLLQLPGRVVRAAGRRLRPDPTPIRNWEVQYGGPQRRAQVRALLLDPGSGLDGLVERAPVEHLLRSLDEHPDGSVGYTVSMLVSFAAWRARHG